MHFPQTGQYIPASDISVVVHWICWGGGGIQSEDGSTKVVQSSDTSKCFSDWGGSYPFTPHK